MRTDEFRFLGYGIKSCHCVKYKKMDGKLIILGHGFMRSIVSENLSFIDVFEHNLGQP